MERVELFNGIFIVQFLLSFYSLNPTEYVDIISFFIYKSPKMLGAPQDAEITAEDTALVNSCAAAINAKAGTEGKSYTINKMSSQVVAGTNKFFHLTAAPGNDQVTVTIFVPLGNEAPQVSEFSQGHKALQIGH